MIVDNEIPHRSRSLLLASSEGTLTFTCSDWKEVKVLDCREGNIEMEEFDSRLINPVKTLKTISKFFIMGDDYFINVFSTVHDRNKYSGRIKAPEEIKDFTVGQFNGRIFLGVVSTTGKIYLYQNVFNRVWDKAELVQVIESECKERIEMFPRLVNEGSMVVAVYEGKDLELYTRKDGDSEGFSLMCRTKLNERIDDFTWSSRVCSGFIKIALLTRSDISLLSVDLNNRKISNQMSIPRSNSTRSIYLDDNTFDRVIQLDLNGDEVKE